ISYAKSLDNRYKNFKQMFEKGDNEGARSAIKDKRRGIRAIYNRCLARIYAERQKPGIDRMDNSG
ncbi:hypothetical protein, partial [Chryseobacterium sp.]|uniref:hypothetical protein n=1 Tax=Chryseobacterium sp. TaxID=1871047 RepID=UPI003341AB20